MSKKKIRLILDAEIVWSNKTIEMGLATDIPGISSGQIVRAKIGSDEKLHIRDISTRNQVTIDLSQLKKIEYCSKKISELHDKNMLGRAVVGGVLFGDVGAVVGAMTGIGSIKKDGTISYFVIDYISQTDERRQFVLVETEKTMWMGSFQNRLRKAAGLEWESRSKPQAAEL